MEVKAHYSITQRNITIDDYELICKATTKEDFDNLVSRGLADMWVDSQEKIFLSDVSGLSRKRKIVLLCREILAFRH